jgi:DNA polymerase-1
MTKLAAILMFRDIERYNLKVNIVNIVHDEIVLDSNEKDHERVRKLLSDNMFKAGQILVKTIPMKSTASIKIF